jgi:hypothetical protein
MSKNMTFASAQSKKLSWLLLWVIFGCVIVFATIAQLTFNTYGEEAYLRNNSEVVSGEGVK